MKIKGLSFLIGIFFCSTIFGQSIFMKEFYNGKSSLSLSYEHSYVTGMNNSGLNGFLKLSFIQPVSKSVSLEGMIGYHNNSGYDDYWGNDIKSGIGNIYLGINKLSESGNSNYSIGIYIPTKSNNVSYNPASFYCNYEMGNIISDGVLIKGNYSYRQQNKNGFFWGIEAGPDFIIGDFGRDEFTFIIHAASRVGFSFSNFKVFGEITNLTNVTSDINNFKDRFSNHYGIGASYLFNDFEIGLNYKNSFDDYWTSYDGNIGVNFKFSGF